MSKYDVVQSLLEELFLKVRIIEGQNLKSGKYDDKQIRKMIMKEIEIAVEKEEKRNEISEN